MIGVRYMMIAVLLGAAAVALGDMQEARALFSSTGPTSYLDDDEGNTDYRSVITLKNVVSATDKPFYHWLIEGDSCTNQGTDIDPDWHCEYDSIVGNRIYRINQPTGQNFDASVYDLEYAKSYRWLFADRLEAKENIFAVLELDPTSPPTPRSTENMTLKGRNNVIVDLGSPGYADAGIDHTCGTLPLFDNNIDLSTAGEYHFKYYCGDEVLERSVHVVDLTPPTAVITVVDGQDYSVKHVPTIERGTDLNDGTYKARMVDNDPGFVPAQLYIPRWSSNQEIGYRAVGFWHVAPNDDYAHRHTDAAGLVYQIKYFQAKIVDTTPPVIRPSAGSGTSFDDPIRINVGNSWYDLLQDVEVFEHDHRVRHELDYTGQVWAQHDINFENPGEYTVTYRAPPDAYGNHPVPVTRKVIVGEDYLTIGEVSSNSTHWILPIADPNPSLSYDFFVSVGDEQGSRSEMTLENKILVTPISIPKIGNGDQFVLVRFGPSGQPYTDHAMFTVDSDNNLRDLLSYTITNNVLERTDEDLDCAEAFGISFSVNSSVTMIGPSLDCDQVDFSTPGIYNVILEAEILFDIHFSGLVATLEAYLQRVAIEVEIVDRTPPQNPWFVEDGDFVRHQLPFGELFSDPGLTSADDHPQHRDHVFHINETVPGPLDIYSPTVTPQYLNYHVADPSGNAAVPDRTPRRSISVQPDTEPPEIRLNGMSPIMLVRDSIAYDPGYTVTDNDPHHDLYENLISNGFIEYFVPPTSRHGAVFTDSDGRQRFHTGTPGIMNITYLARDVKNNEATVTRIIIVRDLPDFEPTTIGDRTVEEHRELSFTVVPNLPDLSSYELPYERASCADLDIAASSNCIFDPESPVFFLDRNPPGATIHLDTGEFSWTPGENQQGTHEFFINIHYGHKFTRNPVTINVTEVNEAPRFPSAIMERTIPENQELRFNATATDPDIPKQNLTYGMTTATTDAAINATTGEFVWTPGEAQQGVHDFTVTVSDGAENSTATIRVTVQEVNDNPSIGPILPKTAIVDRLLAFNITATDPDIPKQTLTYDIAPDTVDATVSSDGFRWTPAAAGNQTFTITVTDPDGGSASASFLVTVKEMLDVAPLPSEFSLRFNVTANTDINAKGRLLDENGTEIALLANGSASLVSGQRVVFYSHESEPLRPDEPYTYMFTYEDDADYTGPGLISGTVRTLPDNIPPVITIQKDTTTVERGGVYNEQDATVNDNDPNYAGTVTSDASRVNADVVATYTVTYTATQDYAGNVPVPVIETVTVRDTTAPTITLNGANPLQHELARPYNDPGARTGDGTPVQTISTVNINEHGDYTVTYTATDDQNNRATATRTVQVRDTTPPRIAIIGANPQEVPVGTDYAEMGANVTDNDPAYAGQATPNSELLDVDAIGDYNVTYTAPADEAGNAPDTVTRTVRVVPVIPADDERATFEETEISIGVLANDPETRAIISITSVTMPGNGNATHNGTHVTYTPEKDYNGMDSLQYTITGGGAATVTINVTAVNDPPVLEGLENIRYNPSELPQSNEDAFKIVDPDTRYGDRHNLSLDIGGPLDPSNAVLSQPNSLDVTVPEDYRGLTTFTVTVTDSEGASDTKSVTLLVYEPLGVQSSSIIEHEVYEHDTLSFNIADDLDVMPEALSFELQDSTPRGAELNLDTGEFVWTPDEMQARSNPYSFRVNVDYYDNSFDLTVRIRVLEDNQPHTFDDIADQTMDVGDRLRFNVQIDDPDIPPSQVAACSIEGAPPGATFARTGNSNNICKFDLLASYDDVGIWNVTVIMFDRDGLSASDTFVLEVVDQYPPDFTLDGENPQYVEIGSEYEEMGATASDRDNPGYNTTVTIDASTVDVSMLGTYEVTYRANPDRYGNQPGPLTREVIVQDTTRPVIELRNPGPIQLQLNEAYVEHGATVSDNDPAYATTEAATRGSVDVTVAGRYIVTYTAPEDQSGNRPDEPQRTVTVVDREKPVITLNPPNPQIIEKGTPYTELGANVTDNDIHYSEVATPDASDVNTDIVGTYEVRYTAPRDEANNRPDSVTRTVTVRDTTAPTITLNGANPLRHELGDEYDDPGATADDGSEVMTDDSQVNVDESDDYTVTYTATDNQNNRATATRTVQVRDTTPPTITITGQATVTVEKGDTYDDDGATVTDNDPDYAGTATIQSSNVNTDIVGTYQVTYTAPADGAGNAPDTVARTVNVRDTTAPVIAILGDNPLEHELATPYNDPGATADDGSTVTADTSAVNVSESADYTVTYTATDDQGNAATPKTRTVQVRDTTKPTITITGQATVTVEKGSTYSDQGATVTDNDPDYSEDATIESSNVNTDVVGTYQVTYTAPADEAGNAPDTVTRTVIVQDTTAPVITPVPPNPLQHELGDEYDDPGANADDGSTVTADTSQVNVNEGADYIVTYTATDDDGNTGTTMRTVQVRDTTAPTITITGQATITVEKGFAYNDEGATVDDNDPDYTGTVTSDASQVDTSIVTTYTVTYMATPDEAGNMPVPVTRTVIVQDTTAPSINLNGANPLQHELARPYNDPGATADDGSPVTTDASAVNVNASADYIVRYSATDDEGNTGTATRTVQVRDTAKPVITLTGPATVTAEKGSTYSDQGATVDDNDPDYAGTATIQSQNVDTSAVGTYQVTYTAPADEAGNAPDLVTRTVQVRDTTAPSIAVLGANPLEHELGTPYTDPGATTDDGTPVQATSTVDPDEDGSYTVTYTATDDQGNSAEPKTRAVNVRDTTSPTITITGQATVTVEKGDTYDDDGATVNDNDPNYAGTVTSDASQVDTSIVTTYTVTYMATPDEAGNAAIPKTRTVNVEDTTVPVITITGANPLEHELGTPYTDPGATTDDGTPVQAASTVNADQSGSYTVTYTATDDQGNPATPKTRTVNVRDTTPPTITITGQATVTVEKGDTYDDEGATVTDNDPDYAGTATVQSSNVDTSAVGTYQVTYTADPDEAGNVPDAVTRTVTVRDTTAPTITLNGDNPFEHELATPYNDPGATADDGSTVTTDGSAVNVNESADYIVRYSATDDEGNTGTATRIVQVQDTTAPTITITGQATVTVEKGSTYSDDGATVTDNDPDYTGAATVQSSNVNTNTVGTYQVTYTAPADEAGNAPDTVARTVIVQDTTAPVITVLGANPLQHELATTYTDPGATADDGSTVTADTQTVNVNESADYTVTYTATDDQGNAATPKTRTVQVRDTTAPTITITGQATITVEKGDTYDDDGATVTDNDPDYTGTATVQSSNVDADTVGTYQVTYTAPADEAGNAPTPVTRTVNVEDTTAPTITVLGNNPLEHELGDEYDDPGATTNDNTPVQTASTVNADQSGSYTVTYTATDDQGNSAEPKTRTVIVRDTTPPTITIAGQTTVTVEKGDTYSDDGATVTDNDPDYTGTVTIQSQNVDTSAVGTYQVTYTAPADEAGNAPDTVTRTVTVRDTTAPVIAVLGDNPLEHELATPYDDPGATADDGSTVTTDDSAVNVNESADYIVRYTATDDEGNTGTATRTVQVRDTTAPTITITGQATVTVEKGSTYSDDGATVDDNDPDYTGTVTSDASQVDTSIVTTYTVTYMATPDEAGNTPVPVTRTVTIRDTTAPTITLNGANPLPHELATPYTDPGATADDGSTVNTDASQVNVNQRGDYPVTYTTTDDQGNAATPKTRTVQVRDTTPPTITITGQATVTVEKGDTYDDDGAIVTDNDPDYAGTATIQSQNIDTDTVGTYQVTYTALADEAGNTPVPVTRTVNVEDTTAPIITLDGANPLQHELGTLYTDPGARTNDGTPIETVSTVDVNTVGNYAVTYTATDDQGNAAISATRAVQVRDTTAPMITILGANPLRHELGTPYMDPGATATDGTLVQTVSTVNINEHGDYTVTYTATDDNDNTVTATRIVEVRDTTPPTITIAGQATVTVEKGATYDDDGATVTDNDPDYAGTVTSDASQVDTSIVATYTVTYMATPDEAGNRPATATRTVRVQDTTASVITLVPPNPLRHELGTPYADPGATTDDGTPVRTTSTVNVNEHGDYLVTYTATNDQNNMATATRTVQVRDTTPPSIRLDGANPYTIERGGTYDEPGAKVADNDPDYAGTVIIQNPLDTDTPSTYIATYTAPADEAGNEPIRASRAIIVQDTTAPTINLNGANPLQHELGTLYNDPGATASDGSTVNTDASRVNINERGDYTVTYTATDDEGNTGIATRIVQVRDTAPPVIVLVGPATVTIERGSAYGDRGATVTDNDPDYTGTATVQSSNVNPDTVGTYQVTYTAPADEAGNRPAPATRTVTVQDTTAPVITVLGANPLMHEQGTPYTDPGAAANDGSPVTTDLSDVNANVAGTYTVTYDVQDAAGNRAMQANRTVIVRDTIAPVITVTGNGTIILDIGEPYNEPGATVTDNDPAYAGTVSTSGVVNVEMRGSYDITYTAPSDAAGNAPTPASRTVIVSDTTPPVLGDISDMTVYVGDLLEFTANATDDGPTLIFSLAKRVPDGATIDADGAFAWRPASGQQGIHTITVSVSDGLLADSQDISITVKDRNLPPDIPDDMEYKAYVDIPMFYQVPVRDDHHPNNPQITFAVNGDKPDNVTIGNETGVIMWVPSKAQANRTHDFEVMVDDGEYSDIGIVHIQVLEASEAPRGTDADYEWRKTPTFGKSFNTNELIVSCGYSMDEACRDVTDYHVDYKRTIIQTNSTHDFTLKAYGEQVLQLFQIGFGMSRVGAPLNTAEALIEITISPNYTRGSTGYDVVEVVYRNPNNVIDEDAKFAVYDTECQDESELVCVQLNITGVTFREQMYYEPFAIFIMDTDLRSSTFYMNEGILVEGESLNPAPTATKSTKSGNQADTISLKLTRTDKLENIWTDQIGNRWTQNEYGTWMMVYTVPKEVATACTDDENRYCDTFGDKMESHTDSMEAIRDQIFGDIYTTPAFDDLEEAITILDMDGDSRTKFLEQNDMMWIRNSSR